MLRRPVLVAILVYVTLDLSLPAMPGAFVFEPGDSVESLHVGRGRAATDVDAPPLRLGGIFAVSMLRAAVMDVAPPAGVMHGPSRRTVNSFPRATLAKAPPAPASPSEDPH